MGSQSIRSSSLPGDLSSSEISHTREIVRAQDESYRDSCYKHSATISILADDTLLEIFNFYRKDQIYSLPTFGDIYLNTCFTWKWQFLVHVCRRWRHIIFESPRRLKLQIFCTYKTPVSKNLGIWPTFPIVIDGSWCSLMPHSEHNLIPALKHPDRVTFFGVVARDPQLAKMVTVMQEPFPVLERLHIYSRGRHAPALPAKFLGGSAPRLRTIVLKDIPYPALPTLLLSTGCLVHLHLRNIPRTGYISPETMVAGLAALPRLKTFIFEFRPDTPRPDQIHPPPVTAIRAVLPALDLFHFKGACEYLEDLVSQIDCPQLGWIHIHYLNHPVDLPAVQLSRFVDRSVGPKLSLSRHAQVTFFGGIVSLALYRHVDRLSEYWHPVGTIFSCEGIDWQVSDIAHVFSQFSAALSNVVYLKITTDSEEDVLHTEQVEWLHLLHHFSSVQTLYVSQGIAGDVAFALEDVAGDSEMVTAEVLPSLDLICLADQPTSGSSVKKFISARRLSNRPVTFVNSTQEKFDEILKSYVSE